MVINDVKINGLNNPVGFLFSPLYISWNVSDTISKTQSKAMIEVSKSGDFTEVVWEKKGRGLKQSGEVMDLPLESRTTYYCRVTVYGNKGDMGISEPVFFETGKMDEPWCARFIGPEKEDKCHPVLEKEFLITKLVRKARLYMTGVGMFEVSVNENKLGDEFLMPYCNDYEKMLQVMTFAVDDLVIGKNRISILLGKGWYMGRFGTEQKSNIYGEQMAAIAELYVEYKDGSEDIIVTDESWSYYPSAIVESGIYDGEMIDARIAGTKKRVSIFDDGDTSTRALCVSHLKDRRSLPIRIQNRMPVVQVLQTPAGETVLDFGQNFAGIIRMHVNQPVGNKITLEFGEVLQNGNFYRDNLRSAKAQFVYISDGLERGVQPHFTYYGYRYVRVTGWDGPVKKDDFEGLVLHSELERTGYFSSSNEKINRLYENTIWGLKSNFMDIPTDCPQRDERLGWTGDAQVFAPTASYHMDTRAFYNKFLQDLREEQKILNGQIPNFLPDPDHMQKAGSIWGDIATLLPDTLYRYYGNIEQIKMYYPIMKDWVDAVWHQDKAFGERHLFDFAFTFGDWLALDGTTPSSFKGNTDDTFLSSMYYCNSAGLVAKMAHDLGYREEEEKYTELQNLIRQAIYKEYFTPSGRLAVDTQAAYVCALNFNIYPNRDKIIEQFRIRLKKDGYKIRCGFAGAPLLCRVLADNEMEEIAYDILLNESYPGWLYCLNLGATTIWERWNSILPDGRMNPAGMNSLNHYSYGSVAEFLYASVGGIKAAEPGFQKATIAPKPDVRIPEVTCGYHSVNGIYQVEYEIQKNGELHLKVQIPFNCMAELILPGMHGQREELGAGCYEFRYMPEVDYIHPYHKQTTLARLSKDKNAVAILQKYVPAVAGMAMSGDLDAGNHTLMEISFNTFIPRDPGMLEHAISEVEKLAAC